MSAASQFQPLRNIQDIEELERVPLEQRLLSWDVNDWIRHGCDLAPQKVAIRYVEDGNPESSAVTVTYRELKQRATAAANLFHSLGVGPDDAVLYLLPTTPHLYTVMLGSLAAGVSCCINWMLEPEHWAALIKSSRAKVVVALGPTPGYEIWEKLQLPKLTPRKPWHGYELGDWSDRDREEAEWAVKGEYHKTGERAAKERKPAGK